MPIYGYRAAAEESCDHCRGGFEIRQGVHDERLARCPECGAAVKRVILPFAYSTGFGNKPPSVRKAKEQGFRMFKNEGDGRYREL